VRRCAPNAKTLLVGCKKQGTVDRTTEGESRGASRRGKGEEGGYAHEGEGVWIGRWGGLERARSRTRSSVGEGGEKKEEGG